MEFSKEEEVFIESLLKRGRRESYQIAEGRSLINVHPEWMCEGRGCVIHHPSEHRMKNWPKDFIFPEDQPGDWGHFMRYCQHRVAHPDPDDIAYWAGVGRDITVHTCDGCCQDPATVLR